MSEILKNNEDVDQSISLFYDCHVNLTLTKTSLFEDIINKLSELNNLNLQDHLDFKTSYGNTYDLTHESDLNNKPIKLLFDQNIPEKLKKLTGRKYVLGDLVLRKSKSKKSYMPWHRDTYQDRNGKLVVGYHLL